MVDRRAVEGDGFSGLHLARVARHGGRNLLEATFVPVVLFYSALWTIGVWGALWIALAYTWGAIAVKSARGKRVPGILVLGAVGVTVRTVLAMASGSMFVYFLQPTVSAFAIGVAFCGSVALGRPLAMRLAADFCPITPELQARPAVRRLCNRLSLLWGGVNLVNALVAIWLLTTQPVATYVWTKTVMSMGLTGIAATISITAGLRLARAEGLLPERRIVLLGIDADAPLAFAAA
ncbi:MAG: conserved hypothetical rane protein [Acidimicrobiales bacterium]|jgi:hypothetical protein|nr:conserved hypothetical rane protein [Acidimicrobiales bacterium]